MCKRSEHSVSHFQKDESSRVLQLLKRMKQEFLTTEDTTYLKSYGDRCSFREHSMYIKDTRVILYYYTQINMEELSNSELMYFLNNLSCLAIGFMPVFSKTTGYKYVSTCLNRFFSTLSKRTLTIEQIEHFVKDTRYLLYTTLKYQIKFDISSLLDCTRNACEEIIKKPLVISNLKVLVDLVSMYYLPYKNGEYFKVIMDTLKEKPYFTDIVLSKPSGLTSLLDIFRKYSLFYNEEYYPVYKQVFSGLRQTSETLNLRNLAIILQIEDLIPELRKERLSEWIEMTSGETGSKSINFSIIIKFLDNFDFSVLENLKKKSSFESIDSIIRKSNSLNDDNSTSNELLYEKIFDSYFNIISGKKDVSIYIFTRNLIESYLKILISSNNYQAYYDFFDKFFSYLFSNKMIIDNFRFGDSCFFGTKLLEFVPKNHPFRIYLEETILLMRNNYELRSGLSKDAMFFSILFYKKSMGKFFYKHKNSYISIIKGDEPVKLHFLEKYSPLIPPPGKDVNIDINISDNSITYFSVDNLEFLKNQKHLWKKIKTILQTKSIYSIGESLTHAKYFSATTFAVCAEMCLNNQATETSFGLVVNNLLMKTANSKLLSNYPLSIQTFLFLIETLNEVKLQTLVDLLSRDTENNLLILDRIVKKKGLLNQVFEMLKHCYKVTGDISVLAYLSKYLIRIDQLEPSSISKLSENGSQEARFLYSDVLEQAHSSVPPVSDWLLNPHLPDKSFVENIKLLVKNKTGNQLFFIISAAVQRCQIKSSKDIESFLISYISEEEVDECAMLNMLNWILCQDKNTKFLKDFAKTLIQQHISSRSEVTNLWILIKSVEVLKRFRLVILKEVCISKRIRKFAIDDKFWLECLKVGIDTGINFQALNGANRELVEDFKWHFELLDALGDAKLNPILCAKEIYNKSFPADANKEMENESLSIASKLSEAQLKELNSQDLELGLVGSIPAILRTSDRKFISLVVPQKASNLELHILSKCLEDTCGEEETGLCRVESEKDPALSVRVSDMNSLTESFEKDQRAWALPYSDIFVGEPNLFFDESLSLNFDIEGFSN